MEVLVSVQWWFRKLKDSGTETNGVEVVSTSPFPLPPLLRLPGSSLWSGHNDKVAETLDPFVGLGDAKSKERMCFAPTTV